MQQIDRITIEEYGISDELLMENAGFECVNRFLEEFAPHKRDEIGILCGGGNNGGDGFVIARHLFRRGYRATVFLFVQREKLQGIALDNFERLFLYGIEVCDLSEQEVFDDRKERIFGVNFLIDSLLGIGFKGRPRGVIKSAIPQINGSGIPLIAIDMPSGVDADGGQHQELMEGDLLRPIPSAVSNTVWSIFQERVLRGGSKCSILGFLLKLFGVQHSLRCLLMGHW
jgi:NAD(P)H-hydrate epimerase